MWMLGCVIYELIILERLFKGNNYFNIGLSILNDDILLPNTLFEINFILKKYIFILVENFHKIILNYH